MAEKRTRLLKIVSGGQTGVDRAALDVALELDVPCGGWCPKGRRAEDGAISAKYPLKETPSSDYTQRTEWNVKDSDGTLIVTLGKLKGGTAFTVAKARRYQKPCYVVDLQEEASPIDVLRWLKKNNISILNVAGPRQSSTLDTHLLASSFLRSVFSGR